MLEVMVVVSIVGMLASLAMPLWSKATASARLNLCLEKQRKIYEAVAQYELEQGRTLDSIKSSGATIRNVLVSKGYFANKLVFECPASSVEDYDDYILTYNGSTLQGTVCLIFPATHVAQ